MKVYVLTKKQTNLRKKLTLLGQVLFAPIWLPLVALVYIFSFLGDFLEEQVLDRGENLLDDIVTRLARQFK